MLTPQWEPDFPADVRSLVEPILARWLLLLPTWCQDLRVRYRGDNENTAMMEVSHRNRWALLTVTGNWLDEPADAREEALIHELIHVALEPAWSATSRIIEDLTTEESSLQKLASSMAADGLEATVDDLARSIQRLVARVQGPNVSGPVIRQVPTP